MHKRLLSVVVRLQQWNCNTSSHAKLWRKIKKHMNDFISGMLYWLIVLLSVSSNLQKRFSSFKFVVQYLVVRSEFKIGLIDQKYFYFHKWLSPLKWCSYIFHSNFTCRLISYGIYLKDLFEICQSVLSSYSFQRSAKVLNSLVIPKFFMYKRQTSICLFLGTKVHHISILK